MLFSEIHKYFGKRDFFGSGTRKSGRPFSVPKRQDFFQSSFSPKSDQISQMMGLAAPTLQPKAWKVIPKLWKRNSLPCLSPVDYVQSVPPASRGWENGSWKVVLHLKRFIWNLWKYLKKKIPDTPSTQCILGNVIALGTPKNLLLDSSCLPGESTRPQSHEGCCLTRTQAERKCRFKWWIVTDRIVCYKDLFQAEVWLAMLGIGFHATSKRWAFQVDGSCEVAACALKLTTFPASANI